MRHRQYVEGHKYIGFVCGSMQRLHKITAGGGGGEVVCTKGTMYLAVCYFILIL